MTHFEQVIISAGIAVETLARYMVAIRSKQKKATLKEVTKEMYSTTDMPLAVFDDATMMSSIQSVNVV
jgi:hypothetical protein